MNLNPKIKISDLSSKIRDLFFFCNNNRSVKVERENPKQENNIFLDYSEQPYKVTYCVKERICNNRTFYDQNNLKISIEKFLLTPW